MAGSVDENANARRRDMRTHLVHHLRYGGILAVQARLDTVTACWSRLLALLLG